MSKLVVESINRASVLSYTLSRRAVLQKEEAGLDRCFRSHLGTGRGCLCSGKEVYACIILLPRQLKACQSKYGCVAPLRCFDPNTAAEIGGREGVVMSCIVEGRGRKAPD